MQGSLCDTVNDRVSPLGAQGKAGKGGEWIVGGAVGVGARRSRENIQHFPLMGRGLAWLCHPVYHTAVRWVGVLHALPAWQGAKLNLRVQFIQVAD